MRNGKRSAERAAELVALEWLPLKGKEIAGIQLVIAQEFEQIAVELIAAGLGCGVEEASSAIEFSGVGILLDAELLQGIDRGLDEGASLVLLADVDTVQKE